MARIARFVVTFVVVVGVISGGAALAAEKSPGGKPGNGCGDKNHTHYREHECKHHHPKPPKPPKHDKHDSK